MTNGRFLTLKVGFTFPLVVPAKIRYLSLCGEQPDRLSHSSKNSTTDDINCFSFDKIRVLTVRQRARAAIFSHLSSGS